MVKKHHDVRGVKVTTFTHTRRSIRVTDRGSIDFYQRKATGFFRVDDSHTALCAIRLYRQTDGRWYAETDGAAQKAHARSRWRAAALVFIAWLRNEELV